MPNQFSRSLGAVAVACFAIGNWTLLALYGCGSEEKAGESKNPGGPGGSSNAGTAGAGGSSSGRGGASSGGSAGQSGANGAGGGGATGGSGAGGTAGAGGSGTDGTGGSGGAGGTDGSAGRGGSAGSAGTGGSAGSAGSGGTGNGGISTDPNLKIAFIGDTATGANYTNVLNLVKSEQAAALVVEGDMSYSADPNAWWSATEAVLGTSFPVFISRGNHDDSSWSGYLPKAQAHLGGATRVAGKHDANYKTTFRGLVIATIQAGDPGSYITPLLENDDHIWKVCNWHQNQEAMQVGGKSDEMGWEVYETCRRFGAIIQTGHEHSYSRTKTLVDIRAQTVDTGCATIGALCVGPGRTFVNVVGLGGNSVRAQTRCLPTTPPYGCNGEWAFIYTSNQSATYGAQFIVFNTGDPRRGNGYFKNVNGLTVDSFAITASP